MSNCADRELAQKLYAYELGLLSEDEQRAFEIHLYKCEGCFREYLRFTETAKLLRDDPDVREDVRRLAEEFPPIKQTAVEGRRWKTLVPAAVLAAAALVILLLKPWKIDIGPTQEATAVESYVAVMYFDNVADRTDSLHLGEIATNLLITDLSESSYLRVMSGQRLYDLLKLIGREGQKSVSQETAGEIADSAGADMLLLGTILQVHPHLIITTQLIDVPGGHVLAAQQVTGAPGENIFTIVDRISTQVKHDLALPTAATQEPDPLIASITTNSTAAYRAYLRGIDLQNKLYTYEAIAEFREALSYDSTFAMAYYYLARLTDQRLIAKAIQYSAHVNSREKYLINSSNMFYTQNAVSALAEIERGIERFPDDKEMLAIAATYCERLQKYQAAIDYYHRVLKVDPLYKTAYNNLAYIYEPLGEYELAIDAINAYIRLAPDEANPYDSRGEIYARNGQVNLAVESFHKALEINPEYRPSRTMLGDICLIQGKYDEAERWYRGLATDKEYTTRVMGRMYLPWIPAYQGKLYEALRLLQEGIARDLQENPDSIRNVDTGYKHNNMARIYLELGDFPAAVREFQEHMEIFREAYPGTVHYDRHEYILLLAEAGELEMAGQVLDEYARDLASKGYPQYHVAYARGCLEFARKNYAAAVDNLTIAAKVFNDFPTRFLLARAYLTAGRLSDAVNEFESLLNHYSHLRIAWAIYSVKMHYYLGLAYEQSSWYDKAIEQYTIFLETWKNADHPVDELADAAERVHRLRQHLENDTLP